MQVYQSHLDCAVCCAGRLPVIINLHVSFQFHSVIHYRRVMCCVLYFIATIVIASVLGQVLEYVEAITLSINSIFRLLYMYKQITYISIYFGYLLQDHSCIYLCWHSSVTV